ncbi:hypothetical protein OG349_34155 [Streptomyces sp. NBC_01317]|uniref:hypothetical protein n=1 Tax=Streptomyces sp. NBC_01317 TaxID=2903822 RepID=UPI002E154443|nr:hypothetical protein OG349_34155 [Streptomyces sp. NBC_01317]
MVISGADTEAGTAVLLAAAPAGKGRLVDATSVLPALATVAPSTLTGTQAATVIELADPLDPQTVLTRIRAAATTAGPLFLYIAGQLQLDHKQSLFHLALARSTPATLRYTGLPWHWLVSELKLRRPGTTTVVVDLVADGEAWRQVTTEGIGLGYGIRLYGRVVPAPSRRTVLAPSYLAACAAIWRSGMRPALTHLHEQATARAATPDALFLAVDTAPASPSPDFRSTEAAWTPSGPPVGADLPPAPGGTAPTQATAAPPAGQAPLSPSPAGPAAQASPTGPAIEAAPDRPAVPESTGGPGASGSTAGPAIAATPDRPAVPESTAGPASSATPAVPAAPAPERALPASPRPAAGRRVPGRGNWPPAWGTDDRTPVRPVAGTVATPGPDPDPEPAPQPETDPHPAILAAARDGRHAEAASIAATWESAALRTYGPGSAQAIHWLEVRADLARLVGDAARSCELWMAAAQARLARGEAGDDKDVEANVDRAHHQWEQLDDPVRARSLAPALTALRRAVPGRKDGALQAIQRRI